MDVCFLCFAVLCR